MTVDETYSLILYITSKNSQQGYVSPTDFNTIINQASKSYADYLLGELEQYLQGQSKSRVEWGQNQTARTRLTPIIYGYHLHIDTTGFSPYPGDYLNVDAMWSIYGIQRVRFVPQDKHWFVYGSVIDPYQTNPYYLIEDLGFRFYPQSYGDAWLSYVRNPPRMIWGYTLDANGLAVYSAALSTQPVWDDASMLEVISRALAMVGVNLQSGSVAKYAQEIKMQGQ